METVELKVQKIVEVLKTTKESVVKVEEKVTLKSV